MLTATLIIFSAYLLGSLSAAIIICRLMGFPDPRTQGSHNPGATNVLRFAGKKAAALTLLGDFLKGAIPVLLVHLMGMDSVIIALTGMAAFLGHLYPLFFQFKGGKGVATAFGVMLGIDWQLGLLALITWLVMAKIFKISSLSALTAALLTPLFAYLLQHEISTIMMLSLLSILLLYRHKQNIANLISGSESSIGR